MIRYHIQIYYALYICISALLISVTEKKLKKNTEAHNSLILRTKSLENFFFCENDFLMSPFGTPSRLIFSENPNLSPFGTGGCNLSLNMINMAYL